MSVPIQEHISRLKGGVGAPVLVESTCIGYVK